MTETSWLFALTLAAYFGASVSYHAHLFTGSERARRAAAGLVALGVAFHTAGIGAWCTRYGSILRDPAMPYGLAAYFVALGQLVATFRPRWAALGSLAMPLAFVGQFYASFRTPRAAIELMPGSPLLRPHVLALILGFAAFAFAFCLAILYLVQSRLLKTKRVAGLVRRLPPLESVSAAAHWLAAIGFSMLTLGILTGAIVAPERWGPTWYLDSRTVTSVVAWVIYAAYLAVSLLMGWRGRRTTYFLIAGFLFVLAAFVISVSRPRQAARHTPPPERRVAAAGVAAARSRPPLTFAAKCSTLSS